MGGGRYTYTFWMWREERAERTHTHDRPTQQPPHHTPPNEKKGRCPMSKLQVAANRVDAIAFHSRYRKKGYIYLYLLSSLYISE